MNKLVYIIFSLTIAFNCNAEEQSDSNLTKTYSIIEHKSPMAISHDKFYDSTGLPHTLEEFENTTVLLNFWATWCTFCTNKMKSLDLLKKNLKKESFTVIALSQDFKGIPVISKFYEMKNIKYIDIYLDKKNKLFQAFKVIALPTSILINKDGKEVARVIGVADWDNDEILKKLITKHLPKTAKQADDNIILKE